MRESDQEVNSLRRLMERSINGAGPFIRESLQMPEHSLSVGQLLEYWDGMLTAAVATTSSAGEPRVAPTGVGLLHGNFLVPTVAEAARARAARARPTISISRFDEGELAIIVHGSAKIVGAADPLFADLAAFHREIRNGEDVTRWKGTGVYLMVTPSMFYTFAKYPDQFPGWMSPGSSPVTLTAANLVPPSLWAEHSGHWTGPRSPLRRGAGRLHLQ